VKYNIEEPMLLNYNGITTIHNNIRKKGLKWNIADSIPKFKLTSKSKESVEKPNFRKSAQPEIKDFQKT